MQVQHNDEGIFHIISIDGEVDASSSIILDNALEKALTTTTKHLLIDCSRLSYISSPGIGVFTSRIEDCERVGTKLVLFGVSDKVYNVFRLLGLDQLIEIVKTKEEAKTLAA